MEKFHRGLQNLPKAPNHVRIFTDGSCYPNPNGVGGYAFIIIDMSSGQRLKGSGKELNSTNNRMELMAAIESLKSLKRRCTVELVTDSEYLGKGITLWMEGWCKRNWRGIANGDLWSRLYVLVQNHDVYVSWIRGHTGHLENEECDRLAAIAAGRKPKIKTKN